MAINSVSLSGNLSRDAELKQTKTGHLLSGTIVVNERFKNAQGEWEEKPCFVDFTLFGPRSEKIVGYLTKGTKVALTGSLTYDQWTDKQNNKRSKLSVIVREIEFFRPSNVVMDAETAVKAAQPTLQHMPVTVDQAAAMQAAAYQQFMQQQGAPIHY